MKLKNGVNLILSLSVMLFSCGETNITWESEDASLLEDRGNLVYYKGEVFTGAVIQYFENGKIEQKNHYKKGSLDRFELYYENGQLDYLAEYNEGVPSGTWEAYYENGQLESKKKFIDGKLEGKVLFCPSSFPFKYISELIISPDS